MEILTEETQGRILRQTKLPIIRRLFVDTPSSRSKSSPCDRFIPIRNNNNWQTTFEGIAINGTDASKTYGLRKYKEGTNPNDPRENTAYGSLLKNEILGDSIEDIKWSRSCDERPSLYITPVPKEKRLFNYNSSSDSPNKRKDAEESYSSSPISQCSQNLLKSPHKAVRKISKLPFKVLDAPELQDDFYLNLVDWSQQNVLSVGLGSCVYLWSACTSQVTKLCDLSMDRNSVTSVSWNERGNLLAVGTHHGYVSIWDIVTHKVIQKLSGHSARVGALAWNADVVASGSRDRQILLRDVRSYDTNQPFIRSLEGHRQEVCGLKWSPDNQYLASGGNDNKLFVWSTQSTVPAQTYSEHSAAVKAIAWSPHHHGLLASGGGTADRCIRFWNTLTAQPMHCVDTGSQVCNLAWSKHSSELVSTHGYSQNQILVWKYPSLVQIAKLTGHSFRVLYLALSPDGETIVTGAGDETLRFWNVFTKIRSHKETRSVLSLYTGIR